MEQVWFDLVVETQINRKKKIRGRSTMTNGNNSILNLQHVSVSIFNSKSIIFGLWRWESSFFHLICEIWLRMVMMIDNIGTMTRDQIIKLKIIIIKICNGSWKDLIRCFSCNLLKDHEGYKSKGYMRPFAKIKFKEI